MTNAANNTDALRSQYRRNLETAKRRLGWDAATLKDNASGLADYYMGNGESTAQAWVSAVTETISVACENLDA